MGWRLDDAAGTPRVLYDVARRRTLGVPGSTRTGNGVTTLQIERLGPETLALSGDLDFASFDQLSDALDGVPGAVTLDLSGLTFMDSTGLRLILKRLREGPVTLVGTSPHIRRMIELCGLAEQSGSSSSAIQLGRPERTSRTVV
jgi:anti-sigma B factor antagonist